jgi:hypothetical protein
MAVEELKEQGKPDVDDKSPVGGGAPAFLKKGKKGEKKHGRHHGRHHGKK